MRILHTSDWHIGRMLYGRKRYEEFAAFLSWLSGIIQHNRIDVLLVAGDIFDTNTPSNRAQELYYRFLCRIAASDCRHVVVIAGNHDSPSFLNAPKELLKVLNVHVVGSMDDKLENEVLVLQDRQDNPELIVCAVPYLRDRDIRTTEAGERIEEKEQKLIDGIRNHYAIVASLAEEKRKALGSAIPIVGMGHLFTAGGQTVEGDGVRQLYVGSLAHITAGIFPPSFDYLALGHLHVPQMVGGQERIRYSGSPLPMGFGEAKQQKSLCMVQLDLTQEKGKLDVDLIDVPVFQRLECIRGNWEDIEQRILTLSTQAVAEESTIWIEVIYEGDALIEDLNERLEMAVSDAPLEILRVRNNRIIERILKQAGCDETLDDLDVNEVFERCLDSHEIPDEQRGELIHTYREALLILQEDDIQAE